MKTAIFTISKHHGNTRKLADAIAKQFGADVFDGLADPMPDWNTYDVIGVASGVAYGKLYKPATAFVRDVLPQGKRVFFLYSCGRNDKDFAADVKQIAASKGCEVLGAYGCSGFDTFGPLKLVGGVNKGHPDAREIQGAVDFYASLMANAQKD